MSLDAVQRATHAFLKPLDFRKKGRTHNRLTEGGLTQVINFQMGEYPVGNNYVIPGLRESLYGQFAVNLGVMLPCIYDAEHTNEPPATIQEYHCTIRERLSCLAFGKDTWLELTPDTEALSSTIVDLLDRFGLPFFDQFQSYEDVLKFYDEHGDLPFQNSGRASVEAALIAKELGDDALAGSLFDRAYSHDHKGFKKHVAAIASKHGHQTGERDCRETPVGP